MIVEIRFRGPTDTRGARYVARRLTPEGQLIDRVSVPYDYSLRNEENHRVALRALVRRQEGIHPRDWVKVPVEGGYLFVSAPNVERVEIMTD